MAEFAGDDIFTFYSVMTFQVVERNLYLDKDDLFYLCTGLSSDCIFEFNFNSNDHALLFKLTE